jgi:hypothetical protein
MWSVNVLIRLFSPFPAIWVEWLAAKLAAGPLQDSSSNLGWFCPIIDGTIETLREDFPGSIQVVLKNLSGLLLGWLCWVEIGWHFGGFGAGYGSFTSPPYQLKVRIMREILLGFLKAYS